MIEFPIEIGVKQREHGVERSVNILDEDASEEFVDTQDWRLKKIQIRGDLRESLDIDSIPESKRVGHIQVTPETLEWEFVDETDS